LVVQPTEERIRRNASKRNIPLATAIEEGRAIGLRPDLEADVRKRLQMPVAQ
jgi:hypothetical protein